MRTIPKPLPSDLIEVADLNVTSGPLTVLRVRLLYDPQHEDWIGQIGTDGTEIGMYTITVNGKFAMDCNVLHILSQVLSKTDHKQHLSGYRLVDLLDYADHRKNHPDTPRAPIRPPRNPDV